MSIKQKIKGPPRLAEWFLKKLVNDERESPAGDFEEYFNCIIKEQNLVAANIWYIYQIITLVAGRIITNIYWNTIMLKDYLKIAFRNIKRNFMHSFINIAGLGTGLAVSLLIMLWVNDELSYDQFHEKGDTIYKINEEWINSNGTTDFNGGTPYPLGPALENNYPEVKSSLHFTNIGELLISNGETSFYENGFSFADSTFFDIFSFPLAIGDPKTVLMDLKSVVISESMAQKYFGNEDPVGKSLIMNKVSEFTVTGIMKDIPPNSHLQFDFIGSWAFFQVNGGSTHWWAHRYQTYVQLEEGVDAAAFGEKVLTYINDNDHDPTTINIHLQAMTDIYLRSGNQRIVYSYIFSLIALVVLIVACINFMNLATAQSINRAKEVGMRKVVGAYKKQIIKQYLVESMLLTMMALFLALICVFALLPEFNVITGKELNILSYGAGSAISGIIAITFITGLLASSYPALYISSFNPLNILKGIHKTGSKSLNFRRILVVAQFTLSTVLLIGIFIVSEQVDFMRNKNIGINKENIVYFRNRGQLQDKYGSIKAELLKHPDIEEVTKASSSPMMGTGGTTGVGWQGKPEDYRINWKHYYVDYNYIETFGLKISEGRDFSQEISTDATEAYIINETGAKVLGFEEPIGKMFSQWGRDGTIVGVVKDFHFSSLHSEISPLILRINPMGGTRYNIFAKIKSEDTIRVIDKIKDAYKSFEPDFPCEIHFIEEEIDRQYLSDVRIGMMFKYFSILAIFISCLGIFGLSSFIAEQRTKEIGIRKVLGATQTGLIALLSTEFVKLILLANLIAWPTGWYIMRSWLERFHYRTDINIWAFVLSGAVTLLLTVLTVSIHTGKASRANPVDSLRSE